MSLINGIKKIFNKEKIPCLVSLDTIMPRENFWRYLQRERERSDRSGLESTLAVFAFGNHEKREEQLSLFLSKLQNRLRATDELGWFDDNKIGINFFNANAEGAWVFTNNLDDVFGGEPPYDEVTVYQYPDHLENGNQIEKTRRLSVRVNLNSKVELFLVTDEQRQNPFYLEMENISTGGIWISTETPLPLGSEVEIHLKFSLEELKKLPGRSTAITAMGQVVRADQNGMGISFQDAFSVYTSP